MRERGGTSHAFSLSHSAYGLAADGHDFEGFGDSKFLFWFFYSLSESYNYITLLTCNKLLKKKKLNFEEITIEMAELRKKKKQNIT